jgi:hypothetical protein
MADALQPPLDVTLAWVKHCTGLTLWTLYQEDAVLPTSEIATIRYTLTTNIATVVYNTQYRFSPEARMEAMMHELLELSLIELWEIDSAIVRVYISGRTQQDQVLTLIRDARDTYISRMLEHLRFWVYDVPQLIIPDVLIPTITEYLPHLVVLSGRALGDLIYGPLHQLTDDSLDPDPGLTDPRLPRL